MESKCTRRIDGADCWHRQDKPQTQTNWELIWQQHAFMVVAMLETSCCGNTGDAIVEGRNGVSTTF